MQFTVTRLTLAAATSVGLIAALTLPSSAVAAPPPTESSRSASSSTYGYGSAASPEMLHAMQRDFGITKAEAKQRIASDRAAIETEQRLRAELGVSFAGAWISDSGQLHVATSDPSERSQIGNTDAKPRVVEHSVLDLDAVMTELDKNSAGLSRAVPGWYVDVDDNTVVVMVAPGKREVAERFVAESGVSPSAVRIDTSTESPRPYYNVRGGDAYYIGRGTRCSIGFSVEGGFVSAGHCGNRGQSVSGYNQVGMGTFAGSSFPGNDYSWVRVTSAQWTLQPWVNNYRGGNVIVEGHQEASVGARVCRSGSTTGWHCGTIQSKNQTVRYPQGTVRGLTRTNACAEPGDSGGSWLTGQQAQGVTSGGSGNCSSGGIMYFQPVNEILSAYNLTLLTRGGDDDDDDDDDQDPPSGTWAAGTSYSIGDTVTYNGTTYRCRQAHTAIVGWEPPNVPALWLPV